MSRNDTRNPSVTGCSSCLLVFAGTLFARAYIFGTFLPSDHLPILTLIHMKCSVPVVLAFPSLQLPANLGAFQFLDVQNRLSQLGRIARGLLRSLVRDRLVCPLSGV